MRNVLHMVLIVLVAIVWGATPASAQVNSGQAITVTGVVKDAGDPLPRLADDRFKIGIHVLRIPKVVPRKRGLAIPGSVASLQELHKPRWPVRGRPPRRASLRSGP